jgi:hypothetical protein
MFVYTSLVYKNFEIIIQKKFLLFLLKKSNVNKIEMLLSSFAFIVEKVTVALQW